MVLLLHDAQNSGSMHHADMAGFLGYAPRMISLVTVRST